MTTLEFFIRGCMHFGG